MLRGPPFGSSCHTSTEVRIRKCTLGNTFVRKSVSRSCVTRRRCWRGLVSSARLLDGVLSCLDKGKALRLTSIAFAGLLPPCW